MRQALLRLVCDECGVVLTFETMNSEPLTATMDVAKMTERHGWSSVPKIGSAFSTQDVCPQCQKK